MKHAAFAFFYVLGGLAYVRYWLDQMRRERGAESIGEVFEGVPWERLALVAVLAAAVALVWWPILFFGLDLPALWRRHVRDHGTKVPDLP